MRRSAYMTKEEIVQESLEQVAEWAGTFPIAVALVGGGFTFMAVINIFLAVLGVFFGW